MPALAREPGPVLLRQELGGVVAHVPDPLDDHPLALQGPPQPGALHVLGVPEELPEGVLHPPPRGLHPSPDAPLRHRLPRDARNRIDVVRVEHPVGVRDPGHLAGACPHVGRGHVQAGADVTLLRQLLGEPAGDALHLRLRVVPRIDAEPPLRPAEGGVHDRALVGHQGGQGLHVVLRDRGGEADAPLHGQPVLAVHGPPADEGLVAIPKLHEEADLIDTVADLDMFGEAGRQVERLRRPVKHPVDALLEGDLL